MLTVQVEPGGLRFGERLFISFQRTLRIPDDGRVYPLPPGLGPVPVARVEDYADRVPAHWSRQEGDIAVFIPLYQREALWLAFQGAGWRPNAVKVGAGKVNAVSGDQWDEHLRAQPQDYVVCPPQPWLDGINSGEGTIRQFVAMPLGQGYTIEEQVAGTAEFGGIQLRVYDPRPGLFPEQAPPEQLRPEAIEGVLEAMPGVAGSAAEPMGLAAGGQMRQKIYPDPHGVTTWDRQTSAAVFVHIVNSAQFRAITGRAPPPTPIDARLYTAYGLPWFALFDDDLGDIPAAQALARVKSIEEQDREASARPREGERGVPIDGRQVQRLRHPPEEQHDEGA